MAYFHSKWVRSRGGLRGRVMRRVVGETLEEMKSVARLWPEQTSINWPPRGRDSHRSKSLPMLWIDADRSDILITLESCEVSEEHLVVLTWMIRQQWYESCHAKVPDDVKKFFELEIRGNLIRLLRAGSWVDEPETLGLKNLNNRLEKIDLGRRSDLKFSSRQSDELMWDRDSKREDLDDTPEWERSYRNGATYIREQVLEDRPWMRTILIEKYGKP